jgi:hypothetical protein
MFFAEQSTVTKCGVQLPTWSARWLASGPLEINDFGWATAELVGIDFSAVHDRMSSASSQSSSGEPLVHQDQGLGPC